MKKTLTVPFSVLPISGIFRQYTPSLKVCVMIIVEILTLLQDESTYCTDGRDNWELVRKNLWRLAWNFYGHTHSPCGKKVQFVVLICLIYVGTHLFHDLHPLLCLV